jgi:hypothetical protein
MSVAGTGTGGPELNQRGAGTTSTYLLQGFVVDEASRILGHLKLTLLDLLAELPGGECELS